MRVKMVAQMNDRKRAPARVSSDDDDDDDDDVDPGEDSDPAVKTVGTSHLDHAYVADLDDGSVSSSESSSETTRRATRAVPLSGKAQDSSSEEGSDGEDNAHDTRASGFCTIQNPIFEGHLRKINSCAEVAYLGKQTLGNSIQLLEDILGNDECDDEGKYANEVDERSRLMAAAQAASIPSDDSFSDDSGDGSPHARSVSTMPKMSRGISTRMVPAVAKADRDSGSAEGSTFLSFATDSERSSSDDESPVNTKVRNRTGSTSRVTTNSTSRKSWRNSVDAEADDQDDGSSGSDRSDLSSGNEGKGAIKRDVNSASFSAISSRFKWSNVKTKVFYSFRALKASAGSSSEGSRTIFVRNLAREVTEDHLNDFFQDAGRILDIWLIRDAQSGLNSAYVEFESGNAARRAVRKSGKNLEGRVVLCDIAYENSKGSHSVPASRPGVREGSELFESDSSSISNRVVESQSALKLFHPVLQEGDAKFLSRFSEQFSFSSYADTQASARDADSVSRGRHHKGRQGPAPSLWPDSYADSMLISGKTSAELEQSVYFDAENMEGDKSLSVGQRKGKFPRFGGPWKWPRWRWWQFTKPSYTSARRNTTSRDRGLRVIDTRKKKSEGSVKVWC